MIEELDDIAKAERILRGECVHCGYLLDTGCHQIACPDLVDLENDLMNLLTNEIKQEFKYIEKEYV